MSAGFADMAYREDPYLGNRCAYIMFGLTFPLWLTLGGFITIAYFLFGSRQK